MNSQAIFTALMVPFFGTALGSASTAKAYSLNNYYCILLNLIIISRLE